MEVPEELVIEMADRPVTLHLEDRIRNGYVIGPAHYPGEWVVGFDKEPEGETTMAISEAEKIKEQIAVWQDTAATANLKIAELKEKLKTTGMPPMPPVGVILSVEVQFENNPNRYQFLIKHVPFKGYYTTGTLPENSYFRTWEELWAYFNGPDVVFRTGMVEVKPTSYVWGQGVDRR